MTRSALVTHEECLRHLTPPGHPEQVAAGGQAAAFCGRARGSRGGGRRRRQEEGGDGPQACAAAGRVGGGRGAGAAAGGQGRLAAA